MAERSNPLLIAMREKLPHIPCVRTYTTVRKTGVLRVKFFCLHNRLKLPTNIVKRLEKLGFRNVKVHTHVPRGGYSSLSVFAEQS